MPPAASLDPDPQAPHNNELRALSTLAFEELSRFPGAIRDTHLGIAERAFRGVGPAARPVQVIHDTISAGAYGAIASAARLVGRSADVALQSNGVGEDLPLSASREGSAVIAALNGLIGDHLERSHSPLHQQASVRVAGEPVAIQRESVAGAFPEAGPRLVVFLHGLMGTEFYWQWGAEHEVTYGSRLQEELALTPVYVRYNTGRHISENGRSIAALIEQLTEAWPVEVEQIVLVGHSMGGLVARSAAHHAAADGRSWTGHVSHVITLGTPHLGAPLEQGAHRAAVTLYKLPETRMLAGLLRRRSAGIRDLRHGSLVDEDWQGRDPEALRAAVCQEVPLLAGATHCFVSATLTRDPGHPVGRLLGDSLVLVPSATGRGSTRLIPFDDRYGHHVGPTHHLALLNHPEVYERLRGWLGTPA